MKTSIASTTRHNTATTPWVCPLDQADHVEGCGGKAERLGRMIQLGLPVPNGFVITDQAFCAFLKFNALTPYWPELPAAVDAASTESMRTLSRTMRERVVNAEIPEAIRACIDEAVAALGPAATLIVRSSALGEDGAHSSFAGQLDSFLHVDSDAALYKALLGCWASFWSERSLSYQVARKTPLRGMGVVVQEQVASRISGVLFTQHPEPDDSGDERMLLEFCRGFGDALVSGRINPNRVEIPRGGLDGLSSFPTLPGEAGRGTNDAMLTHKHIRELVRIGLRLEVAFRGPQDIEWTIGDDDELYIVQSRPVTAIRSQVARKRVEPERAGEPRRTVLWSNANVNENFPEPISPLLYSIAREGYYHYFRNLGLAVGISQSRATAMEQPLSHLIGVHGARMYYNLSNIHAVLKQAPLGDRLVGYFNGFVGASSTADQGGSISSENQRGRIASWLEIGRIALRSVRLALTLNRRVGRFEERVADFADRTDPSNLAQLSMGQLHQAIHEFLDIRFHRWTDASLADAAAMISYGCLKSVLQREFPEAELASLHNTLLKGLRDLASSEPIARLWDLSRMIRSNAALRELLSTHEPQAALEVIQQRDEFVEFRRQWNAHLREFGYRCSGELMLTVPSFQERPADLLEIVRAYAALDGTSPVDRLAQQNADRVTETNRVLAILRKRGLTRLLPWPSKAWLVRRLLTWTQRSIALRERARSKQALLYSRLRHVALAIGTRLVASGRLDESDDIFYLTWREIDELLAGAAMFPDDVKELVRIRKTGHRKLGMSKPPDVFELAEGDYLAPTSVQAERAAADSANGKSTLMRGVGACGGTATGPAAVLKDVTEFNLLSQGDVLVARQTDPGWGPVFFLIRGLVMERGGMLSHGAILAREYGIPTVVGVKDATSLIAPGRMVVVDGDRSLVEFVEP